jgi:hypothetical protein
MAGSATGNGSNKWNSRISNSVMYTSPRFYGVQGQVMYATPESNVGTLRPYLLSGSLTYNGPLYLAASYEYRKSTSNNTGADNTTPTTGILGGLRTTDQAFRVGAGYKYQPTFTRIALAWEYLKAQNDVQPQVAIYELTKTTFWGALTQGIFSDTHQIVFVYGMSPDYSQNGSSVANTGANYWNLGYHFNWTSDLKLYATYQQLNNSSAAKYVYGSQGLGAAQQFAGATSKSAVLGIQYLF